MALFSLQLTPQPEIAADVPVDLDTHTAAAIRPIPGRTGTGTGVRAPPRFTFDRSNMLDFARTFMQTNPLYLNLQYATAQGFRDLLASPQMVFNVTLSLGVQNDSEKAIANLGYYQVQFLQPVYPGDTLRAFTKVLERKDRGPDKPGIARIRTVGVNQDDQVVLQYERKIMVAWRGDRLPTTPAPEVTVAFPGKTHQPWICRCQRSLRLGPHRPQYLRRGFQPRRYHRARQWPHDYRRAHGPHLSGG